MAGSKIAIRKHCAVSEKARSTGGAKGCPVMSMAIACACLETLLSTEEGHHESATVLCPAPPKRVHSARTVGGASGAGTVGRHRGAEVLRPTGPFRSESGQGANRRLEQSPGPLPPGGRPLPVDRTGLAGAGHCPCRRTALDR